MFGEKLRELREQKGITQTELAKAINVSTQNISYYENGREPNFETVNKISDYFDVSIDYLFGKSQFRNFTEEYYYKSSSQKYNIGNETNEILKTMLQEQQIVYTKALIDLIDPLTKTLTNYLEKHLSPDKEINIELRNIIENLTSFFKFFLTLSENECYVYGIHPRLTEAELSAYYSSNEEVMKFLDHDVETQNFWNHYASTFGISEEGYSPLDRLSGIYDIADKLDSEGEKIKSDLIDSIYEYFNHYRSSIYQNSSILSKTFYNIILKSKSAFNKNPSNE